MMQIFRPPRFTLVQNRWLLSMCVLGLVFCILFVLGSSHDLHQNHEHVDGGFATHPDPHAHMGSSFDAKVPPSPHHSHLHFNAKHHPATEQFLRYFKNEAMALNTCVFLLAAIPVTLTFLVPSSMPKFLETLLVAFASGSLLGDLFLHTFPSIGKDEWLYFLAGFLLFYAIQRILFLFTGHSCHSHGHAESGHADVLREKASADASKVPATVFLHIVATLVHTFSNGLLLALAFLQGLPQGFSGFLALFFHELPHRLSDFTLLQTLGASNGFVKKLQLLVAMSTLVGSQVVHLVPATYFSLLLPMATGGLMYIATTTILPVLIHSTVTGFKGFVYLIFEAISMAAGIWVMMQLGHDH